MLLLTILAIRYVYGQPSWLTYTFAVFPYCQAGDICHDNHCIRTGGLPLTYCVVDGSMIPDPQIGYTGPCDMTTIQSNTFCIDCKNNNVCTYMDIDTSVNSYLGMEMLGASFTSGNTEETNILSLDSGLIIAQNVEVPACDIYPGDDEYIDSYATDTLCYTPSALYNMKGEYSYGFNAQYCLPYELVSTIYNGISMGNYLGICMPSVLCLQFGAYTQELNPPFCLVDYDPPAIKRTNMTQK